MSSSSNFRLELERPPTVECSARLQGNFGRIIGAFSLEGFMNPENQPLLGFQPGLLPWAQDSVLVPQGQAAMCWYHCLHMSCFFY